jgi:hypothetical protein
MKKLAYLPVAVLLFIAGSCSMRSSSVKEKPNTAGQLATEKALFALMQIKDTVRAGDSVLLSFTVYNHTDSLKKFLKWQTPFEPLMSKYLEIKNEQGEEVSYKGPMAKRMMPPPAAAFLTLSPKDSLSAKVDVLKGYDLTAPGKYTVAYTSENISGLKVRQQVTFVYR